MIVFSFTLQVDASASEAFRVVADPRSKLMWVPAIRRVEMQLDGPPALGTRYLTSSGFGPLEFVFDEEVTEWVEDKRLAYRGCSRWGAFEARAWFEPADGGTRVRYQMDYTFPVGWLGYAVGWALTRLYRRAVEAATVKWLKSVIEQRWSSGRIVEDARS